MTRAADSGTQTAKVVVQAAISLDGYIAGPGHDMDWVFEFTTPDEFPEIIDRTGAMLSGRNSYDVGQRDIGKPSGDAYGGAWHGPMFVLTHRPPADDQSSITFLSGDIGDAVELARKAAGDKDLVVLGADVVRQCLERGLVDEMLLMVLPVLLGDGVRLYSADDAAARVNLERLSVQQSGDVAVMQYRVGK